MENYSIIKCKPIQGVPWNYDAGSESGFHGHGSSRRHTASPHYHIVGSVDGGSQYTIVINIESRDNSAPMLRYYIASDFRHPITAKLTSQFGNGYEIQSIESIPDTLALDYVRGGLFDQSQLKLENTTPDGEDSLNELIDGYIKQAISDNADMYAFGQEYSDNPQNQGVHDIHMNQGNEPQYENEDGVDQDGGLLIYFPSTGKWMAMFFAFQSQSFNTDPNTGRRRD